MVQDNKWGKIFISVITILFTFIIAILTYMSFFEHCIADIHNFSQIRFIDSHQPMLYVGMACVGILLSLGIVCFIDKMLSKSKDGWKSVRKILIVCSGTVFIASIFWIFFNDATPKYDQKVLFDEARRIAGYVEEEYSTAYFEFYPRNKGIMLIMAFMLKILGDSMISFRILNVVGAVILLLSISFSVKKIWTDEKTTIVTALLLTIYYPIIIYTCYLYGTLLSTAFSALGVYATIRFCEDKKFKYLVLALLSFPLGVQMHQSAAIVMIAAMFYIVIYASKKTIFKTVICLILMVGMVFASNKAGDIIYYDIIAKIEPRNAVPTLAYVYMGLSAVDGVGGPGSQDGSNWKIYEENNLDVKATNRDALNRIAQIFSEYVSGERSLKFFEDKVKFQWLDPTFGSRRILESNYPEEGEPPNSEAYLRVRNSHWRNVGFKFAVVGLIITYGLNLFAAIYQIIKKKQDSLHFFIQILLIGGFVFQLFWESISRYCFSYFIWLIPGAAYGLVLLYKLVINKVEKNHD